MIFEFRITLKDVGIPVWRDVQIPGEASLYDLHQLIQSSFDWMDMHLHSFFVERRDGIKVERVEIEPADPEEFESNVDTEKYIENEEIIADWFLKTKDKMTYVYDFGDNWEHEIVLSKIIEREDDAFYPRCMDAKNYAPPEDSRGEIIMGEVDLACEDTERLIDEINEEIRFTEMTNAELTEDYWPKTLAKAKEFQQLKPWEVMTDEHIFAIEDPDTGEYLFCSVLGQAEEMYGLAVYVGADGFFTLIDSLSGMKSGSEIVKHQRSLLVSFEDRTDLEQEEYDIIKSYDVSFRGKKAWPSFVSFKPGFYPWMLDEEEVRQMYIALNESIKMFEQIKDGLHLPHIATDEKILVKYTEDDREDNFEEMIMGIDEIVEEISIYDLVDYYIPTELEIKRAMKKAKKPLNTTVEFQATYLEIPIQEVPGERPIFPSAIFVADHEEGLIYSHNMYDEEINSFNVQQEFLKIFDQLGGTPKEIITDHRTYSYLTPILEHINVSIELDEELPVISNVLEEMQASIAEQLEE